MNIRGKLIITLLCLGLFQSIWTQAQSLVPLPSPRNNWVEAQKLTAPNAVSEENFGYDVAMSGDGSTLLIGAKDRNGGRGSALVYVLTDGTWTLQQEISDPESQNVDEFGFSVDLSKDGNTAVIGSLAANQVYIYSRIGSDWTLSKTLTENTLPSDRYGSTVSLSPTGDILLVGAQGEQNGQGAVYTYRRVGTEWVSEGRLVLPGNPYPFYSGFGAAVVTSANTALISAITFNRNDVVFVYQYNGSAWVQQQMLQGEPDTTSDINDYFGWSLALDESGTTALISEWGGDDVYTDNGAVYVYVNSGGTWSIEQKLIPSNPSLNNRFGWAIDLTPDGSSVLISAAGQSSGRGAAYLYTQSGNLWSQQHEFLASDGNAPDIFGMSVALGDDAKTALIGARGDALVAGSAYVFVDAPPVIPTNTPTVETPTTETPQTSTPTPIPTTPDPNIPISFVRNGGFEEKDSLGQPIGWKIKGGDKSKLHCKNPYAGGCAFRFKGEQSRLRQKIKLENTNLQAGDQLKLNFYANSSSPIIDAQVVVQVRYSDGTGPSETTIFITQTSGYVQFSGDVTLSSSALKNIRLQVKYGGGGNLWVDDMTLTKR
jgi:hypothetical protein